MPSAGPRSQCGLRLEVERARLAVPAHFDVVRRARARPARSRAAGSAASSAAPIALLLDLSRAGCSSCLICCARALLAARIGDGVEPLPLGARDLVARRVLLALQPFELGDQPAPRASRASRSPRAPCPARGRGCAGRPGRRRCDRARTRGRAWLDPITERRSSCRAYAVRRMRPMPSDRGTMPAVTTQHDPQSRLPGRRSRHPVPARDQGAAEGNAAARRQADHPVRRRGGGRVRRRQHHPGHRPRQERDRRSLRRVGRARDVPRGARQEASSSTRSARSRT